MKTGLVLEGGAMRGMFTAGALDVMMEEHISVDGVVGVSAGAIFGYSYLSGQQGRSLRYNLAHCRNPEFCSFRSLLRTGDLYGAEFCYHTLPDKLDPYDWDAFARSKTEFYIVCTDMDTGEAVYHRCEAAEDRRHAEMEWLRASASMPLVSRIVEVDGLRLLDGGVADSIPLRYFESLGFDRNVVILTQPEGYVKKKNRSLPAVRLTLGRYPRFVDTMARRHEVYNDTLRHVREAERRGTALVIAPEAPLPIGRTEHDPERIRAVYDLGRRAAEKRLAELKAFVGE